MKDQGLSAELISSWINDNPNGFDTFTSDGSTISSAVYAGGSYAQAHAQVNISTGKTYKAVIDITINSGDLPYISLNWGTAVRLKSGKNYIYFLGDTNDTVDFHIFNYPGTFAMNFTALCSLKEVI